MSSNNLSANPFDTTCISNTSSIAEAGTYSVRIVSMKCWTHDTNGEEHPLPSMGLICQIIGDSRQIKMTMVCPDDVTYWAGYSTKVSHVLKNCGMINTDFYTPPVFNDEGKEVERGEASDVLRYKRGTQNHERCPVGKQLRVRVTPDFFYCRTDDDTKVTPVIYNEVVGDRPLRPLQFWKEMTDKVGRELCQYTGYHTLKHSFKK